MGLWLRSKPNLAFSKNLSLDPLVALPMEKIPQHGAHCAQSSPQTARAQKFEIQVLELIKIPVKVMNVTSDKSSAILAYLVSLGPRALLAARGYEAPLAGPERGRREEAVADHAHRRRVLEVGGVDADALLQHDVARSEVPRRDHEPGTS